MRLALLNVTQAECIYAWLTHISMIGPSSNGWVGMINTMSSANADSVTIINIGGRKQAVIMENGEQIIKHGIKILVRSDTEAAGLYCKKIETALTRYLKLVELPVENCFGETYNVSMDSFSLASPTAFVGIEDNQRSRTYSLNGYLNAKEFH